MDHKLGGLLQRYAILLVCTELRRTVFCAPTPTSCEELHRAESLTAVVELETNKLLDEYVNVHFQGTNFSSVPGDVPNATVPGNSIRDKLQNIFSKNQLFGLHIAQVEEYEDTVWSSQLGSTLSLLNMRLSHHSEKIKSILTHMYPDLSLPPTPAPPQLSHGQDFKKKEYGRGVLIRLKEWTQAMLLVFEEMKNMCRSRGARLSVHLSV